MAKKQGKSSGSKGARSTKKAKPVAKTVKPAIKAAVKPVAKVAKVVTKAVQPVVRAAVKPVAKVVEPVIKAIQPVVRAAVKPVAKVVEPVIKAIQPNANAPATPSAPKAARPPAKAAAAGSTPLEQAERLRDDIQRTKLSHPDPWTYGAKARGWGERAQAAVMQIATGGAAAGQRAFETLQKEVEADRDFLEARRLL